MPVVRCTLAAEWRSMTVSRPEWSPATHSSKGDFFPLQQKNGPASLPQGRTQGRKCVGKITRRPRTVTTD